MSNLFERIRQIQPHLPGWCCPEKAEALAAMVLAIRPETTIEIGVHGGSSFIPLALAHKEIGKGTVWGIDAWNTAASVENELPENVAFWKTVNHDQIYGDFMNKIQELQLESCTRIIRTRSDNVESPRRIDILHVDGSHTDQAIRDVVRFAPNVRVGGFCVMDDLSWTTGGPERAAQRLMSYGFTQLYPIGTGAVFQRAPNTNA